LTVPSSVSSIGSYAFFGCSGFSDIFLYAGTQTQWNSFVGTVVPVIAGPSSVSVPRPKVSPSASLTVAHVLPSPSTTDYCGPAHNVNVKHCRTNCLRQREPKELFARDSRVTIFDVSYSSNWNSSLLAAIFAKDLYFDHGMRHRDGSVFNGTLAVLDNVARKVISVLKVDSSYDHVAPESFHGKLRRYKQDKRLVLYVELGSYYMDLLDLKYHIKCDS